MINRINNIVKQNLLVIILIGLIGMVSTPVSIGASWFAYNCQLTINESIKNNTIPEPLTVHFRNVFFVMAIIMGPLSYFSTIFIFKLLVAKQK